MSVCLWLFIDAMISISNFVMLTFSNIVYVYLYVRHYVCLCMCYLVIQWWPEDIFCTFHHRSSFTDANVTHHQGKSINDYTRRRQIIERIIEVCQPHKHTAAEGQPTSNQQGRPIYTSMYTATELLHNRFINLPWHVLCDV